MMKTASCSPSSIQSCSSTISLISTAGLAASYATQHCAFTRATTSSSLRVTVHMIIYAFSSQKQVPPTITHKHRKSDLVLSGAVPRHAAAIFFPFG